MVPQPTESQLKELREGLGPLDFETSQVQPGEATPYLDYFGLRTAQHEHHFGNFRSSEFVLAAHAYIPRDALGTVVLMHGFLDHVGILGPTIQNLLEQGFAVAAYDQPGHGLSSGPRASIQDFDVYASVLSDFLRILPPGMPRPYHAIGHSTGAAILVNQMLSQPVDEIEQVILVAPLVRSALWGLSRKLGPIVDAVVDEVPRVFHDNTSNEAFEEFIRADPLQPRRASLTWFNALVEWNERIETYPPNPRPITIIQGDADSVVDWNYNIKFLRAKFPAARVEIIEGGQHQLLNEAPKLRAQVLRIIDEVLSDDPPGQ